MLQFPRRYPIFFSARILERNPNYSKIRNTNKTIVQCNVRVNGSINNRSKHTQYTVHTTNNKQTSTLLSLTLRLPISSPFVADADWNSTLLLYSVYSVQCYSDIQIELPGNNFYLESTFFKGN